MCFLLKVYCALQPGVALPRKSSVWLEGKVLECQVLINITGTALQYMTNCVIRDTIQI